MKPGAPVVLPERIRRLKELAYDLWWTWNPKAREVFRRLDYSLWRLTSHNAARLLCLLSQERLLEVSEDPSFLLVYDAAIEELDRARTAEGTWWRRRFP